MNNASSKHAGRFRIGTALAGACALALLHACGAADPVMDQAATATAASASNDGAIVPADGDVRQKVLVVGPAKGFVASALSAAMPAGTEDDYDLLVIGDADQSSDAALSLIQRALAAGKQVVFDAASDGSGRSTHGAILRELAGTRIDAAAVRVQKADVGYYITPIDPPAVAAAKFQASALRGETPNSNSLQSVFGIPDTEFAK
jgi:hypothetical protein